MKTQSNVTDRIIAAMLTENTGAALCDSGGAYGRNHERNRGKTVADFRKEPEVSVSAHAWAALQDSTFSREPFKKGDTVGNLDCTISTFHFLSKCLDRYESDLTRKLWRFGKSAEWKDAYWMGTVDGWLESIGADEHPELGGDWINTYNGEDALSQTLQYRPFRLDGRDCVALQIHGGCDVRGGYTRPRVFSLPHYADVSLWDNNRFSVDDGGEGQWDYGMGRSDFEQYTERHYPAKPPLCDLNTCGFTLDAAERGKGKIYVSAEGIAHSPLNGEPLTGYIL